MKKILRNILKKCGFEVRRYELSDEVLIKNYLNLINADLMIDVGANTGQSRDFMRNMGYKGRIISFEPLASAHQCLMERSKVDHLWEIAPRMALGDSVGTCTLNVSRNLVSSSVLNILPLHMKTAPESSYIATEKVPCATLDSVWDQFIGSQFNSIFLKIDVQGYEDRVINGTVDNIHYMKGLRVELSVLPLYEEQFVLKDMLQFIDALGFELFALLPGFEDNSTGRILQLDGLFFRNQYGRDR
ncbi:MAG: FkbM family methyltransferase [Smithella sp.]|jgi:FkbM family methyltransferase